MINTDVKENFLKLKKEVPSYVIIVGAVKNQSIDKVKEAILSGLTYIGHNYIKQAEEMREKLLEFKNLKWHFIGHLQKNKVKKAVLLFDMIESVDSYQLLEKIDKYSKDNDKIMPVLLEVNIAKEKQKYGIYPEDVLEIVKAASKLKNIKIKGLMTMGPRVEDAEDIRPYFYSLKKLFDSIKQENIPSIEMKYLSMGMSSTYKIAIQEGANIIRIGEKLFGKRIGY